MAFLWFSLGAATAIFIWYLPTLLIKLFDRFEFWMDYRDTLSTLDPDGVFTDRHDKERKTVIFWPISPEAREWAKKNLRVMRRVRGGYLLDNEQYHIVERRVHDEVSTHLVMIS